MNLRAWAEKNNETLNCVFTQYLLGNRSFEESALDALEVLMEDHTDTKADEVIRRIEEKMRSLSGKQEEEYLAEEMLEFLEEMSDILKDRSAEHEPDLSAAPVGGPGILPDHEITLLARAGMIEPFEPVQVSKVDGRRVLSYGVSSYGYDARVADDFKVFTNTYGTIVDPKNFDDRSFVDVRAKDGYIIIPPNSFVLGRTVERFRIPRDVLVVCVGKSTYARTGLIVNVTPLEPCWEGHVTLEFSNTTPLPAKLYANEGACQFLFFRGSSPCKTSYSDRKGKYQGQTGVTPPRMVK
jgi:dCTP deaminase